MELIGRGIGDGFLASVSYHEQKTVTTPKTTPKESFINNIYK